MMMLSMREVIIIKIYIDILFIQILQSLLMNDRFQSEEWIQSGQSQKKRRFVHMMITY